MAPVGNVPKGGTLFYNLLSNPPGYTIQIIPLGYQPVSTLILFTGL